MTAGAGVPAAWRGLTLSLLALLAQALGGCARLPPVAEGGYHPGPLPPAFEVEARWSLRQAGQAWHGSLDWQQQGTHYRLQLRGPLGQGGLRLTGGSDGVLLEASDGRRRSAADAGDLLAAEFGAPLPVAGLRYWMLGRPDPARPASLRPDAAGRLQALTQDGWEIRYLAWQGGEPALPSRLRASRGEDLELRLVIDRWSLPPPDPAQAPATGP